MFARLGRQVSSGLYQSLLSPTQPYDINMVVCTYFGFTANRYQYVILFRDGFGPWMCEIELYHKDLVSE